MLCLLQKHGIYQNNIPNADTDAILHFSGFVSAVWLRKCAASGVGNVDTNETDGTKRFEILCEKCTLYIKNSILDFYHKKQLF